MLRVLAALAVAALVSVPAAGQPNEDPPDATIFKLTTTPAAAPVPAMRYEFVPRATERTHGNAALDYAHAAQLLPPWPEDPEESRALDVTLAEWEEASLDDFPVVAARAYLEKYADGFAALDAAALRDHCVWRPGEAVRVFDPSCDTADIQKLRQVVRLNRLRVRRDLARRNFDAAARAIRSGIRLAEHFGERTNAVHLLVGVNFQSISWGDAIQFVGRPGAPNLYWALVSLPRPLIDIRPGLDGEAAVFDAELPSVAELEKGAVAADVADRAASKLYAAGAKWSGDFPPPAPPACADLTARVAKAAPTARAFLVDHGRKAADVETLPPAQAVVLAVSYARRVFREEQYTAFLRPYPQVWPEVERIERRSTDFQKALADPLLTNIVAHEKGYAKVYHATSRVERQVSQLTAVEAVRLPAAAHNGQPPQRLADVKAVPVPPDPYTGRPFEYAARPDGFTLTAPPPAGERAHRGNSVRFEVTFRR
ncbi:hypothetical protein J0H58_25255 [bacterium]|nr:hypothetical protein [bacterium]